MKLTTALLIVIALFAIVSSKHLRRRRHHGAHPDLELIKRQIEENKTINFDDEVGTITRIEGFIAKLKRSAPQCAGDLVSALHNVKLLYKKLKNRGQSKELNPVAWGNKTRESQQAYGPRFLNAVDCWKKAKNIVI